MIGASRPPQQAYGKLRNLVFSHILSKPDMNSLMDWLRSSTHCTRGLNNLVSE